MLIVTDSTEATSKCVPGDIKELSNCTDNLIDRGLTTNDDLLYSKQFKY